MFCFEGVRVRVLVDFGGLEGPIWVCRGGKRMVGVLTWRWWIFGAEERDVRKKRCTLLGFETRHVVFHEGVGRALIRWRGIGLHSRQMGLYLLLLGV